MIGQISSTHATDWEYWDHFDRLCFINAGPVPFLSAMSCKRRIFADMSRNMQTLILASSRDSGRGGFVSKWPPNTYRSCKNSIFLICLESIISCASQLQEDANGRILLRLTFSKNNCISAIIWTIFTFNFHRNDSNVASNKKRNISWLENVG